MFRLTGNMAFRMVQGAVQYMERDEARINALNVFPVPDGDTGTNMALTVRAAYAAVTRPEGTLSDVAEQMAMGALRGARGNSGTIVSQFFHGFYLGVKGHAEADIGQVADALKQASDSAYAAVLEPKEGTILSVGRRGALAAVEHAQAGAHPVEIIKIALQEAALALEETKLILDVLREADVVDAGGEGLIVGMRGAIAALFAGDTHEEQLASLLKQPTDALVTATANAAPVQAWGNGHSPTDGSASRERSASNEAFIDAIDAHCGDLTYKYCTEFVVQGDDIDRDVLQRRISGLGDSVVIVGDTNLLKVHVHTDRPGQALEIGCDAGELLSVSVENMVEQNRAHLAAREQNTVSAADVAVSIEPSPKISDLAMVAVASGDGWHDLLTGQGVQAIVSGGQTMNPSTGQIVDAIESTGARHVIVLPNNSNIVLTANQAADMANCRVSVIPTVNVTQAVAATMHFDGNGDPEEVASAMAEAAEDVRFAEVTTAVRDARIGDVTVKAGDFIAIVEGDLVAGGSNLDDVVADVIETLNPPSGALLSLYAGEGVDEQTLLRHRQLTSRRWPQIDVEAYNGGQPVYLYWIAVE